MLHDKYDSVRTLLVSHNEALGYNSEEPDNKPAGYVDPDAFTTCIKAAGGTSEDRLKKFSYEDILECLPEHNGVKPKALAKEIAQIFRGKDEEKAPQGGDHNPKPVSAKKADRMTPKELVEHFDPEEPNNPVGKRLSDISRGEPFIVYETGRIVDVDTTTKLLLELKSGFPQGRKTINVGDEIKPVYVIGYLPEHYVDENPIYAGRPLRPDGTCDQLNRSWEGVEMEVRQFIRVGIDKSEMSVSREKAHDYLDWALKIDAMAFLRNRYPEVSVEFDRLKKEGTLPNLQIELGQPVAVEEGHPSRPFDEGKQVVWQSPPKTHQSRGTMSHYIARRGGTNPWNNK